MSSRHVRTHVSVLLVAVAFLALANAAVAAPASWSEQTPSPDSLALESRPTVSVHVVADAGIDSFSGNYIKVDGRYLRSPQLTFDRLPDGSYDHTKAYLSAPVHFELAEGSHTVNASVFDLSWFRHRTKWKFDVAVPPTISSPVPVPGSTVDTATPTIVATVTDPGPVSAVTVWVNGAKVPSTYAGGVVVAPVTTSLANDATHTVDVAVVDALGLSATLSWDFGVQVFAAMPVEDSCVQCHTGYPTAHPVDNCDACHGPGSPMGGGYDDPWDSHASGTACSECHGDLSDCEQCHGQPYTTVPPLHSFDGDTYHDSHTEGCSPCHVRRLSNEHNRYGLTCLSCHASADSAVAGAIAAGDTDCYACHSAPHSANHLSALEVSCEDCHDADLVVEHSSRGYSCDTCHTSSDPAVLAAITGGNTDCSACHTGASHEELHVSALQPACDECHVPNLLGEHMDSRPYTCDTCHASADPAVVAAIAANDTDCMACHATTDHPYVSGPHASAITSQTLVGTYPSGASFSVGCTGCHTSDLRTEHGRTTSSSSGSACNACHPSPRDTLMPWTGSCVQGGCHEPATGTEQHSHVASSHVVPSTYTQCTVCHWLGDAGAIHTTSASSCLACHSSTDVPSTSDCSACHPEKLDPHGYDPSRHTATVAASEASGVLRDTLGVAFLFPDDSVMTHSGQQCGACHLMELRAEHTKASSQVPAEDCAACHPSPRDSLETWNQTCQQGDCHATYHADMATKHYQDYGGRETSCGKWDSVCHPGEWQPDLAAVHNTAWWNGGIFDDLSSYPNGCLICHTDPTGVPPYPPACSTCHASSHWIATYP
ncbi:MAG: hypothetical protein OEV43_06455 [Coriobacteriia bacterium]|nr:hypothetical protein [Coriobacteriia bacterium]